MPGRPSGSPAAGGELAADALAELTRPAAYPLDPSAAAGVEWIQTHLSHVFLTGERVYKFRKAVDLGFVRFDTRERRNADCLREVALNRRLARDVYLGVAPLVTGPAGAHLGPAAEELAEPEGAEHCVVMRRLPEGRDALSLLSRGELTAVRLEDVAERLAAFHASHGLGTPAPFDAGEWRDHCVGPAEDCLTALDEARARPVPAPAVERARRALRAAARERAERFEARRRLGRAVDAHGDLHLQHVWFEGDAGDPRIIDCLEFSDSLRRIDAACEVAFLAMDLRYRDAASLAERFLARYARASDDYDLYSVVDFFASYRAAVRAKVAAIAAGDADIGASQRDAAARSARAHLELASRLLEPPAVGALVLVGGTVGAGKSSVSAELADALDSVVVSSDRVRKAALGVSPTTRLGTGWKRGAYAEEVTDAVYEGLLERARPLLASGRHAILDATFGRRSRRLRARERAAQLGAEAFFVEVHCAPGVARGRLARRRALGGDPSDAGPDQLAASAAEFEPPAEWPRARRLHVHTDRGGWREEAARLARGIRDSRSTR